MKKAYRLYLIANNVGPNSVLREKMLQISSAIDRKELSTIISICNSILNECVSSASTAFNDERSIRDIMYAALTFIPSLRIIKEHDTSLGRSDLEIYTTRTCMIVEFKRTYPGTRSAKAALSLACEQLKNKRYGTSFSAPHSLYKVALVISTETKALVPEFCAEVA